MRKASRLPMRWISVWIALFAVSLLGCRGEEVMRVPSPTGAQTVVVLSLPSLDPPRQVIVMEAGEGGERTELMRLGEDREWVDRVEWSADGRRVGFLMSGRRHVVFAADSLQRVADDRLLVSPRGGAHLTAADSADGWLLSAWQDTDRGWSQIRVRPEGRWDRAWDFEKEWVQGARWTSPGRQLLAWVIGEDGGEECGGTGGETRLYRIGTEGDLALEWSGRSLVGRFDSVIVSRDGTRWQGSSFSAHGARVAIGRIGETQAVHEWRLDGEAVGRPDPVDLDSFSYGLFLDGTAEPSDVGLLWGGRLWVGQAGQTAGELIGELIEVRPPEGTLRIQGVTSTTAGLWLECYHGMEADPSHTWALYPPAATWRGGGETAVEEVFRAPQFLPDGTVVDVYRREGRAAIYDLAPSGTGLLYLGSVDFPADARTLPAGNVLLQEVGGVESGGEAFRLLPLAERIRGLMSSAAPRP